MTARITLVVADGPCYLCPLCYDSQECRALLVSVEGVADTDDRPDGSGGRYPGQNSDGSQCDPYTERPDWCPLNAGGVEIVREVP